MAWTVSVMYDGITEETHYFEEDRQDSKSMAQLKLKYRGKPGYSVVKEVVE